MAVHTGNGKQHAVDITPAADIAAGSVQNAGGTLLISRTHFVLGEGHGVHAMAYPSGTCDYLVDKQVQANTWDIGDDVNIDPATGNAVATGGVKAGYCIQASTASDTQVKFVHDR